MSKLFSLNNSKLIERDADYWERSLKYALDLYRHTKAVSEDDVEARAVALAGLAGLALSMYNHFGSGVEAAGYAGKQSIVAAGMKAYDAGVKHSGTMELATTKALN